MKAGDIMSTQVVTVTKDCNIQEIAEILVKHNISGVPVVDDEEHVLGIVTNKDLLHKDIKPKFPPVVELQGGFIFLGGVKHYNEELKKLVATKAEDIMTRNVITISEDTEVGRIAEIMVEKDINRIPVTRDKKLVGIIGRADLVKYIAGSMG